MPLLEGIDGVQKMSKSYANFIGINEPPKEMFGKVMSISDEMMFKYYILLTDEDLKAIKHMHPREAKLKLAQIIVAQYHSPKDADQARLEFTRVFSQKEAPQDLPTYKLSPGNTILEILSESGLVSSKNEARRLIQQGGVSIDGIRIDKENAVLDKRGILKAGKRRFLKLER
jgi:tyrosyl-tRNA synthetase